MQEPERTCITCRTKKSKSELFRFVELNGKVFYDRKKRMNGRGYYICQGRGCLEKCLKDRSLKRVFKNRTIDIDELKELLTFGGVV